ncbi:MAG: hypothetical protein ABEJ93_04510 [Candidatus Nanohalobium sp.]
MFPDGLDKEELEGEFPIEQARIVYEQTDDKDPVENSDIRDFLIKGWRDDSPQAKLFTEVAFNREHYSDFQDIVDGAVRGSCEYLIDELNTGDIRALTQLISGELDVEDSSDDIETARSVGMTLYRSIRDKHTQNNMPIQRVDQGVSKEEALSFSMEAAMLVGDIEEYQQNIRGEGAKVAESLVAFLAEDYDLSLDDLDVDGPAYHLDSRTGDIEQVQRETIHEYFE